MQKVRLLLIITALAVLGYAAVAYHELLGHSPAHAADSAKLSAVLAKIKLPPGFHIEFLASAPGARALAVSPDQSTLIVGTNHEAVYRIALGQHGAAAKRFAPGVEFVMPNGPCFAPNGDLFIAEQNRVLRFSPAANGKGWDEAHPKAIVPRGKLIPPAETSPNHSARVCRVGPDSLLYIAIGQPFNVPPKSKRAIFDQWGMGGIIRMNLDGGDREVFARGIRNSVGLDFDPQDKVLWFTDNQTDDLGDDIPPGEINRAPKAGLNFGFPWYGGGHIRTKEYADETPPADVVFPAVEEVAHAADLGMIFYRGTQFPPEWRGIFSAQHGSWARSIPVGARVMFTRVQDGKASPSIPFAEGWNPGNAAYLGRPVDVAELPDGSLAVSDDLNGALYRIFYDGK